MAKRQHDAAVVKYLIAPNLCKFCLKIIPVANNQRVTIVRKKLFCSRVCYAGWKLGRKSNRQLAVRMKKVVPCSICGTTDKFSKSTRCMTCCVTAFGKQTKNELFNRRTGYQSARSAIRRHAETVFRLSGRPYICDICGYSKHIHVAHKKAVSDFDGLVTIAEINASSNLIAFCPNHHWEFDHSEECK